MKEDYIKFKKKVEGNLKKDIVVHNLEMLKMNKEAKELDNNLTEEGLEDYFPLE